MVYGFLTSKPALTECRRNSDSSGACLVIRNLPQGQEGQCLPWVVLTLLDCFFQSSRTPQSQQGGGLQLCLEPPRCCWLYNSPSSLSLKPPRASLPGGQAGRANTIPLNCCTSLPSPCVPTKQDVFPPPDAHGLLVCEQRGGRQGPRPRTRRGLPAPVRRTHSVCWLRVGIRKSWNKETGFRVWMGACWVRAPSHNLLSLFVKC